MSDTIAIRGMRVYGRHGANPGEQDLPQAFEIDLEIEIDLERSAHTDKLEDTLDYDRLHRTIAATVAERHFSLLERLAHEIAREILRDERVQAAKVTVAKPGILTGATPSVTLCRSR